MCNKVVCLDCNLSFSNKETYCENCGSLNIISNERFLQKQIDKLSSYILENFNSEINESKGAVDIAIKIMDKYYDSLLENTKKEETTLSFGEEVLKLQLESNWFVIRDVKKILREQLNYTEDDIDLSDNLINDLGMDSLDAIEIIMGLEEEFKIEITDENAKNIKTVQDVINLVKKLKK